MVLPKIQEGAGAAPNLQTDIMAFLVAYKPLECGCCEKVLGFQHRKTGALMCNPSCGVGEGVACVASAVVVEPVKQQLSEGAVPVRTISSSRSTAAPKFGSGERELGSQVTTFKAPAVKEQDVVDFGGGDMVPEQLTDVNPFFKNISSTPASRPEAKIKVIPAPRPQKLNSVFTGEDEYKAPMPISQKTATTVLVEDYVEPPMPVKKPAAAAVPVMPTAPARVAVKQPTAPAPVKQPTAPAPVKQPVPEVAPKGKYDWADCKFSSTLVNGAIDCKVSFVWSLKKYQVGCLDDEPHVQELQRQIQKYVTTAKPMNRKPVLNEVLLGCYLEEFYRGLVTEINGDDVKLFFVDFGDVGTSKVKDLVEPDDEIMGHPVYSVTLQLQGVPDIPAGVKTPKVLNKHLFGSLQLEMAEPLKAGRKEPMNGRLWVNETLNINQMVKDICAEAEIKAYVLQRLNIAESKLEAIEKAKQDDVKNIKLETPIESKLDDVEKTKLETPKESKLDDVEKTKLETPKESKLDDVEKTKLETPKEATVETSKKARLSSDEIRLLNRILKLKTMQEKKMLEEAVKNGVEYDYVFNINGHNYTDYFIMDVDLSVVQTYEPFEILLPVRSVSLDNIPCIQTDNEWFDKLEKLTSNVESYAAVKEEERKKSNDKLGPFLGKYEQMFIVKWLPNEEVDKHCSDDFGKKDWNARRRGCVMQITTSMAKFVGHWYRGMYVEPYNKNCAPEWSSMFTFYLVDIGKSILVPREFIHKPICSLMIHPQLCLQCALLIENVKQYTPDVHDKWKRLLREGRRLTVQKICDAGNSLYLRLIKPTEKSMDEEYQQFALKKNAYTTKDKPVENGPALMEAFGKELKNIEQDHKDEIEETLKREFYSVPGGLPYRNLRTVGGFSSFDFKVIDSV